MSKIKLISAASGLGLSCCAGGASALIKEGLTNVPMSSSPISCAVSLNMNWGGKPWLNDYLYFYAKPYTAGQDTFHYTDVKRGHSTWDWVNAYGGQMGGRWQQENGKFSFFALAFMAPGPGLGFHLYLYKIENQEITVINPSWDAKQWSWVEVPVWYDGWNYHGDVYLY